MAGIEPCAPEELVRLLDGGTRVDVISNGVYLADPAKRNRRVESELADLRELGLEPVELDLRDHFGRPERLRTAFSAGGADDIVRHRLSEDSLVYAGYSAGEYASED